LQKNPGNFKSLVIHQFLAIGELTTELAWECYVKCINWTLLWRILVGYDARERLVFKVSDSITVLFTD